jgi:outer membrane protein OmpA-like peptidoglycan-associated protein
LKRQPKNIRRQLKPAKALVHLVIFQGLSCLLTPVSFANVIGSDMQNFNATTNGLDFVTVESAETLQPGFLNFGLFMNYAVNTLPYFEKTETIQSRTKFNDTLLGADINIGYGLSRNLDLGLSLPQVVTSSVKYKGWHGKFRDNGNTEVRGNIKYKLIGDDKEGLAVQGVVNINRTKDNPYVGATNSPIYSLVLIGNKQISDAVGFGLNLGYRWRKAGEPLKNSEPIKPLTNQYIWSAAMNYRVESMDAKFIAEVFGSSPTKSESTNGDRTASSSEALLGIKRDIDTNLAIHGGFGTELARGLSSPDWRIYAGINYAMGPKSETPQTIEPTTPVTIKTVPKPFDVQPKSYENIVVQDILFEFNSDHMVVGTVKNMLRDLADHLNKVPVFTKLIIVGHTDSIGSIEYNDELSKRRAETIRKWLVEELKIDGSKITTEGRGEREPIASNGNFQGRQMNRRVEFRIYREGQKDEVRSQSNPKAAEGATDPGEKPLDKRPKNSKAKPKASAKPAKPSK